MKRNCPQPPVGIFSHAQVVTGEDRLNCLLPLRPCVMGEGGRRPDEGLPEMKLETTSC